ncbi:class I SAM-dependent methyltransferase [Paenibacillus sp. GCM10027626]|uniref:class I SAM-dependent methyltransferase n=1 Tax=Paenibacillus sp. GCM10027626 TaxID=3273411 RepID=UPI00363BE19D
MEDSKIKRTALMSAYLRSHHSLHAEPKIFDDFISPELLTEEDHIAFDQSMVMALAAIDPARAASYPKREDAIAYMVQHYFPTSLFLSRARYAEDKLKEAINQGVKQYIILGAGMDTFAQRNPGLIEQLQIFEIDHPATQRFKRNRLKDLGWAQPDNLNFVPIDFTKDQLEKALLDASYDPALPSFFSWLGVIHYLPKQDVFSTFRTLTNIAPSDSNIIFDYWDLDAFNPEKAAKRVNSMQAMLRQAGEPMLTGFDPQSVADELHKVGIVMQEHLSPMEIQSKYFEGRNDDYYAYEHAFFVHGRVK